jgi:hypothetical protein
VLPENVSTAAYQRLAVKGLLSHRRSRHLLHRLLLNVRLKNNGCSVSFVQTEPKRVARSAGLYQRQKEKNKNKNRT